ncbi:MAG: GNAT family N-acetyltransferase [Candidatus Izemoplasmatales bacterium]
MKKILKKIKFIEDKDFLYNEEIIKNLHKYNRSQAGYRKKDKQNFYVLEDDEVLGVAHTNMASDWCDIENIYYQDVEILKNLLNDIKEYYESKVEGIKLNSVIPERIEDFKNLGYVEKGKLKDMPKGLDNVFMLNTDFSRYETDTDFETEKSQKSIKEYDQVLKKANKKIRKSLNFSSEVVDIQFVALDDGEFVGGIYGNFQYDYLFINILFVDEDYRGRQIATRLMDLIEDAARKRGVYNLYLTTFEFQALGFYQKRGYQKVMTIYDFPIGFKEYTVHKRLNKL